MCVWWIIALSVTGLFGFFNQFLWAQLVPINDVVGILNVHTHHSGPHRAIRLLHHERIAVLVPEAVFIGHPSEENDLGSIPRNDVSGIDFVRFPYGVCVPYRGGGRGHRVSDVYYSSKFPIINVRGVNPELTFLRPEKQVAKDENILRLALANVLEYDIYSHRLPDHRRFYELNIGNLDVWSLIYLKVLLGQSNYCFRLTSLPSGNTGVDDYSGKREKFNDISFLCIGLVFFAIGFVLLGNIWWKLSFDFTSNMNVPTYLALILVSCVLIWVGQWLLLCGFGLAPPEVFGHRL